MTPEQGHQAPPYAPPPAASYAAPPAGHYAPPAAYARPTPKPPSRWMAITAISIAIPAALLRFIPFIGVLFIVPVFIAIVFAVLALIIHKRGKGMAIAALVVAVIGLVVPVVLTVLRLGMLGLTIFSVFQEGGWQ